MTVPGLLFGGLEETDIQTESRTHRVSRYVTCVRRRLNSLLKVNKNESSLKNSINIGVITWNNKKEYKYEIRNIV